jgi:hypothetical protein
MTRPGALSLPLPLACLAAFCLAGCPSVSTLHRADPVKPGRWELGAGLDGLLLRDAPQDTRAPSGQVLLAARRGLVEDLDLGARLYTFGLDASVRWRFFHGRTWRVAAIPTLGTAKTAETQTTTEAWHLFAQLPVVFTRDLGRDWTLSCGPRLVWGLYYPEGGGHARGLMLGGFVNAGYTLSRGWELVPELSFHRTVHGEVPVDGFVLHVGAGLLWRF